MERLQLTLAVPPQSYSSLLFLSGITTMLLTTTDPIPPPSATRTRQTAQSATYRTTSAAISPATVLPRTRFTWSAAPRSLPLLAKGNRECSPAVNDGTSRLNRALPEAKGLAMLAAKQSPGVLRTQKAEES
jgi:hypothetical protein